MRAIFTTEEKSSMPGVPTVASLGFKELTGLGVDRYVLAPPGLPAGVTKALSDSLVKAMSNPELIDKADKTGEPLEPLGAGEAKAAADRALGLYLKYKEQLARQS
jgi:tripartite-type tricarboxylate transporter receptor subunit TctC